MNKQHIGQNTYQLSINTARECGGEQDPPPGNANVGSKVWPNVWPVGWARGCCPGNLHQYIAHRVARGIGVRNWPERLLRKLGFRPNMIPFFFVRRHFIYPANPPGVTDIFVQLQRRPNAAHEFDTSFDASRAAPHRGLDTKTHSLVVDFVAWGVD